MTGASESGGQKSDSGWVHLPLAGADRPWCLEWPANFAASARLCLVLTTEQPQLLASPGWEQNLLTGMNAALTAFEQGGDLAPAAWLYVALKLHIDGQRQAGQGAEALEGLMKTWTGGLSTGLMSQLKRAHVRGQGRRLAPRTLADHDAVERLAHTAPDLETADARIVTVAEHHTDGADTGYLDRAGPYAAVKKHHQRVRARAVPLPYLLLPCEHHAGATIPVPISRPHPAWDTLPQPELDDLQNARTITFRPRILLPEGAEPPINLREATTWKSPAG